MDQNKGYSIFARQVGYVILTNIIVAVLGIIQTPILTKILGAYSYGVWALVFNTILLIFPFSMFSFKESIVRFLAAETDKSKIREDFYSACVLVFIAGAVLSLLLFFCSDLIAAYLFKDANTAAYMRTASVLVLLNSLFLVVLSFFRRGTNIGIYTVLHVSYIVLNFALMLFFVISGYELTGVIIASIISLTIPTIISLLLIFKEMGFQLPRFTNMKSYLKWGIPLMPNAAIMWIVLASDRYIIAYFFDSASVGVYNASYAIGQYAGFISIPLVTVLFPYLSKQYDQGDRKEYINYLRYSFKYLMMISIPAAFGLSILSKPLLHILTTPEFIPGSPVIVLIAFGTLFFAVEQICSIILQLVGKTKIIFRLLSLAALLNIILNAALIPFIGIVGAGVGSAIAYLVLGLLALMISRKYVKFDINLLFITKCFAASIIMSLVIWLLKPESILIVAISIIAGIFTYFVTLIIIKGFSRSELTYAVSYINKIRLLISKRPPKNQG